MGSSFPTSLHDSGPDVGLQEHQATIQGEGILRAKSRLRCRRRDGQRTDEETQLAFKKEESSSESKSASGLE